MREYNYDMTNMLANTVRQIAIKVCMFMLDQLTNSVARHSQENVSYTVLCTCTTISLTSVNNIYNLDQHKSLKIHSLIAFVANIKNYWKLDYIARYH